MTKTILEEYLRAYSEQLVSNSELAIKCEQLQKRLKIATKALKDIINDGDDYWDKDKAQEALTKMEGVE